LYRTIVKMSIEFVHRNDEARLRDSISQLKTIRASVQSTLVEVEAIHSELAVGNFPTSQATKTRLRQLELEEAVMRQGLTIFHYRRPLLFAVLSFAVLTIHGQKASE
jgi:hypothetical protein